MSYKKAMKHHNNPRKFKLTATRLRGNALVFGGDVRKADSEIKKVRGK